MKTRRPEDRTPFERRCLAASDAQIEDVQKVLLGCIAVANAREPGGCPPKFAEALDHLRDRPELMLDVAPEFRAAVEQALTAVGVAP